MELRLRPKSDFLQEAPLDSLHVLTDHWKSDIEFFNDELKFLRDLLDKHFIWIIQSGRITEVQEQSNELSESKKIMKALAKKIDEHILHIENLMENPFSNDEEELRNEHGKLEQEIADYVKSFRVLKQKIFATAKEGIDEERLKYLQNGQS